jgi:hypothetical protein
MRAKAPLKQPVIRSLLVIVAAVCAACGSSSPSSPSSPSPGALSGKTAGAALRLALRDATTAGTVRVSVRTQGSAVSQSVVGEVGGDQGDVIVTTPTGVVHIIVTGGTGYLESDALPGLEALGVSSTAAAGYINKWISVTPGSAPYPSLAAAVSFTSTLDEFTPGGGLTLTEKVIAGRTVGFIEGTGSSDQTVQAYHVQMAVTTTAPVTPVGGIVSIQANGRSVTQTAVFSQWGRPLSITAPVGATPLDRIPAG